MKNFFKIIAIIFVLLFSWATYVQNNDSDTTSWYVVYGLAAFASALFAVNRLPSTIAYFFCFLAMIGAYFLWHSKLHGQEAWRLLIVAVVMLVYALRIRFMKKLKV